jgi:hypothetical protein
MRIENMKITTSKNIIHSLATVVFVTLGSSAFAPFASATPINYALNKPATASGLYSSGGGFAIEHGNDGDMNTMWNGGTWSAWWQVDLGAILAIDYIAVSGHDGPGLHMKFQLSSSTNGSDWLPIGSPTVGVGVGWTFTFNTNGSDMRYINYTTIGEAGSDWALLAELQAFGGNQSQVAEPPILVLMTAGLAALGVSWARRVR